jgi:GH24 family phage-related lysozyme (muramidase)
MPYKDQAGHWTIGRGHLINGGKSDKGFEAGITSEKTEELFEEDFQKSVRDAERAVGSQAWAGLDNNRRHMLIDFSFNLGPSFHKEFPNFTAAVLANDLETAKTESTRYLIAPGGGKKRLGRNERFLEAFFPPETPDTLLTEQEQKPVPSLAQPAFGTAQFGR